MSDYPDPTPEILNDPLFEAIWQAIKRWDISRHNDGVYSGPTGNDARHIYDAVRAENDRLREALEKAQGGVTDYAKQYVALRAENDRLREALIETLEIAARNEEGDYIERARAALAKEAGQS